MLDSILRLVVTSSLCLWKLYTTLQYTHSFTNDGPAGEIPLTVQEQIVRDNKWIADLQDFYFTNGFEYPRNWEAVLSDSHDPDIEVNLDVRTPSLGARSDGNVKNSSRSFCWFATAVEPECGDILSPSKATSYFPSRTEHPSESIVVAFVSAINEQMTPEKCGLYCVLQNYPFANYLERCEICLCGLFMDRLIALTGSNPPIHTGEDKVCVAGTHLVGVGINATIISLTRKTPGFLGATNFHKLLAGEEYEIFIKVWHWSRFGFVTVTWDLGNDSIRPNETVAILDNGFGFTRKRFKYSAPGIFRLKLMADDGFHEVFQEIPLEVLPSEGKTLIVATPTFPRAKEVVTFRAPEFAVDARASYMWFFQDPVSFSEVTAISATKAYDESGVYRVDASVTSLNLSKTGSIDVVVEGVLEGLYVACEAMVDVNRIVNIGVRVDKGTHFHFVLINGLPNTEPIISSTGRFKVLYSQPGVHNLSVTAANHIGKLQSLLTISVIDPEFIAVKGFDLPATVVVNESIALKIIVQTENLQDFFFEWQFSDGTMASGPGLSTVVKTFPDTGDVRIKLLITGKKGTRKVLHGVISVVTLCRISPLIGVALETKFRLECKGTDGPLPGLDLQHAIIANPIYGFFDILYPKVSHGILLPDPLNEALNWTVTFPGHAGCDVRDGCSSNCCPVFKANVTRGGRPKTTSEILDIMDRLLKENATADHDHIMSVLLVQCAIIVRSNASQSHLKSLTGIVSQMTADLSENFGLDRKFSLGGQLFELLTVLAKSDDFQLPREGAVAVLRFLVAYVNEMAPQTNTPTPKDAVFGLVKRVIRGLVSHTAGVAGDAVAGVKPSKSLLDLLRPIGRIVGSYVNDLSEKSVLSVEGVTVTAIKMNITRGQLTVHSEGLSITVPSAISAPLAGAPVVLVVGKSSKNWLQPSSIPKTPANSGELYFASFLDRHFKEIDLTSQPSGTGLKIVLPTEQDAILQTRLLSSPTPSFAISPRFASRFRLSSTVLDSATGGQCYLSVALRSGNESGHVTGRVNVALLDALDNSLERKVIPYSDLHRLEDFIVRWSFPAIPGAKYLSVANEGGFHLQMSAYMSVTECGGVPDSTELTDVCVADVFESPLSARTCVCHGLATFSGHAFEVSDFLTLEKAVELNHDHKSAVTVATLAAVALGYILALIATGLRHRDQTESRHILTVGAGSRKYNVLFWGRDGASKDVTGGIFPLKLHVMGSTGRLEYVLSIQRHSAFGYNLLVNILTDRDPGDFTSIRITGRLAESTFPFHYATVSTPSADAIFHFRLTPPRLVEESRGGVVFEVASKPTSFPARKLLSMECQRRLRKDHIWIAAVRIRGSMAVRLEMLSVAATALFGFMGVCALGYTIAGLPDEIQDVTRPFRPKSRDILLGLWTALLVTPLITIVVEILNRCHHRAASVVPTLETNPQDQAKITATFPDGSPADLGTTAAGHLPDPHSQVQNDHSSVTNPLPPIVRMDTTKVLATSGGPHAPADPPTNFPQTSAIVPDIPKVSCEGDKKTTLFELCSLSPLCRRLLAYVLCFTMSCLSVCLILLFGLNYGMSLSLRWLVSFAVSVLVSFIFLEPLKLTAKSLWICYTTTNKEYFQKMLVRCQYGLPM